MRNLLSMKYPAHISFCFLLLVVLLACESEPIEIPRIQITLTTTPASFYGARDGAVTAVVQGGTPPYQYFWSNGGREEGISGVGAGTYTLKVIDSRSALASKTTAVSQPAPTPLNLQFAVTDVSYYGGNDGAVTLAVTGGTSPYKYLWDNGSDKRELKKIRAGIFHVTVTDSGNPAIVTAASVTVAQPAFLCGRDSITDVDGNKYPTVQLGGQCWLAQNLRTRHLPEDPTRPIDGVFCQGTNCLTALGAHYTWQALMNGASSASGQEEIQGVCPFGWHVPTREEWDQLNSFLSVDGNGGPGSNVPGKMRGADSPSGFDALPAGNWGYAVFQGENSVFWTATQHSGERAFYRILNNFPLLGQGHVEKLNGLSARCVKNR